MQLMGNRMVKNKLVRNAVAVVVALGVMEQFQYLQKVMIWKMDTLIIMRQVQEA